MWSSVLSTIQLLHLRNRDDCERGSSTRGTGSLLLGCFLEMSDKLYPWSHISLFINWSRARLTPCLPGTGKAHEVSPPDKKKSKTKTKLQVGTKSCEQKKSYATKKDISISYSISNSQSWKYVYIGNNIRLWRLSCAFRNKHKHTL